MPNFFNKYPYTDFHELNLDWILETIKNVVQEWADTLTAWNDTQQAWHDEQEAFQDLHDYVMNYFDNLDVQQEVNVKIDQMVQDGTFDALLLPMFNSYKAEINTIIASQNNNINLLKVRMDGFEHLTVGSTTGDAELIDARIGANGLTYNSAGDAIRALDTISLDNIHAIADVYSVNMYNKDSIDNVGNGSYILDDGSINIVPNSGYMYTHLIPVKTNEIYCCKTSSDYGTAGRKKVYMYDYAGDYVGFISGTLSGSINTFQITDASVVYIRLNTTESLSPTLMVLRGVDYSSTYIPYELYADLKGSFQDVFEPYQSANLFDNNSPDNVLDSWILNDGTINTLASSGYMYSYPIPIEDGHTYCYNTSNQYGANRNKAFLYDEFGAYIETLSGTLDGSVNIITINNPAAKYLKINMYQPMLAHLMVVEGSEYPVDFIPYNVGRKLTDGTLISDAQYDYILSLIEQAAGAVSDNPLRGKKAAYMGDSIAYGYGYTGGYGKIIGDNNNMTVVNVAVSGANLVNDIVGQLSSLPNDADYYIFEGGINDYWNGHTIGTVLPWGNALDPTTVTGAIETICNYLCTNFSDKKFGFIFPHRMPNWGTTWDTSYRPAMKTALEKWGIPYIDLDDLVLPIAMNASWKSAYTDNADGIHPNQVGYTRLYVPKIEAWMKTL